MLFADFRVSHSQNFDQKLCENYLKNCKKAQKITQTGLCHHINPNKCRREILRQSKTELKHLKSS